jgi:D-amino-acid dehydrogenase
MNKTAIVIGAGVVGLCSAFRLVEEGWSVRIIDPRPAGEGCSAGNPGGISTSSILPAASPGVIRNVPGWLLDRDGPLTIRPSYLLQLAPWLLRFLHASDPVRFRNGMEALSTLTRPAAGAWVDLLSAIGRPDMLNRNGHLIVYRSAQQFALEAASWQRRADLGISVSIVEESELRALVPALASEYSRARRVMDNGWLIDPLQVCRAIEAYLHGRGVTFIRQEALRLSLDGDGMPRVQLQGRVAEAEIVVLAAGAWSARLAAGVGDRVPLQPERGYSVTWDAPDIAIPMPVFSPSEKIMAAPTRNGIRFAGTAEFAGFNAEPRWERADSLERLGRRLFPKLASDGPSERWAGLRPSTPDGLPVLGYGRRSRRIIHAFGHGHLGVTSAAVTATMIADFAAGRMPAVDARSFSVKRF